MLFTFVSGDIGGARMQLPVIQQLEAQGIEVRVVVDSAGMAHSVFAEAGICTVSADTSDDEHDLVKDSHLLFVSSCGSASGVGIKCAKFAHDLVPVVVGSDGLFNHGMQKYRDLSADVWFAITEDHGQAIRSLRPGLAKSAVRVVGQPSFDSLIDIVARKDEIRIARRRELEVNEDDVVALWWSQGMPEAIGEDIIMIKVMLNELARFWPQAVFVPRLHPKLDRIKPNYIQEIMSDLTHQCERLRVRIRDGRAIPGEELNLAADMICTITCTEDLKNTMVGGPPVIHFLGPEVRRWLERDINLTYPFLPDVASGISLAVFEPAEIPAAVSKARDPAFNRARLANWQPPTERAADRIVRELITIAKK